MVLCDYEASHFVKKLAMKLSKMTFKLFCKRKLSSSGGICLGDVVLGNNRNMVTWTEWKPVQWCKSLLGATQRTAPRCRHCISFIFTFITVIFTPWCKYQYLVKMQSTGLSAHSHCQRLCAPPGQLQEPLGLVSAVLSLLLSLRPFVPYAWGDGMVTVAFYSGNNSAIWNGKNLTPIINLFLTTAGAMYLRSDLILKAYASNAGVCSFW